MLFNERNYGTSKATSTKNILVPAEHFIVPSGLNNSVNGSTADKGGRERGKRLETGQRVRKFLLPPFILAEDRGG